MNTARFLTIAVLAGALVVAPMVPTTGLSGAAMAQGNSGGGGGGGNSGGGNSGGGNSGGGGKPDNPGSQGGGSSTGQSNRANPTPGKPADPGAQGRARAAEVKIDQAVRARMRVAPHFRPDYRGGAEFKTREITAIGMGTTARQRLEALGFRVLTSRRLPSLGNTNVVRLRTPPNLSPQAALQTARQVAGNVGFDLSHVYRPAQAAPQYGPRMVGFAPDLGTCRAPVRIGLIDTMVVGHPALTRVRLRQDNFVEAFPRNPDPSHGTAIASILVGSTPGTGPLTSDATLYSANVFYREGDRTRTDAAAIIEAIDWMVDSRVRIVNLSLMGPPNGLLQAAINRAARRGVIFVAAAGNNGPSAPPVYPAAYNEVIAVSAVDGRGRAYSRSNRGRFVEFTAPGVDIWAARAGGGEAYWTGTSFAAPFVTATLAHGIAAGQVRDINSARRYLQSSARDLGARGRDTTYGWGLVQSPVSQGC